jgi:hypothetical protein
LHLWTRKAVSLGNEVSDIAETKHDFLGVAHLGFAPSRRRVAVLYGPSIFACRDCHRLAYDSQRTPAHDRALARAQAIRERLGGRETCTPFPACKPKGMHLRTYRRLRLEAEKADARSWPPSLLKLIRRRNRTFASPFPG